MFAKIFETEKYGQILVVKSPYEGMPSVKVVIETPNGTAELTTVHQSTASAEAFFENTNEAQALEFADDIVAQNMGQEEMKSDVKEVVDALAEALVDNNEKVVVH